MYANFFGLKQAPFAIAPDPRYLFMSERHRDALAHLLYGLQGGGGFVLLSGEIGAGKTTVCRCFLEQIPERCNVAYIFNPKLTVTELLQTVCEEYGVQDERAQREGATVKQYVDRINEFLLRAHASGQNSVLIIDEAQNLSADVLEQLRLLTNLETHERKLLQIVLIGQPELRTMLERPELEQLAQRVIARFHLDALSEAETGQYVRHRLSVAGFSGVMPFDGAACRQIYKLSRGLPRRINLLCDRALLGAYAQGSLRVDRPTLEQAAVEVFGKPGVHREGIAYRYRRSILAAALALALAAGTWWLTSGGPLGGHADSAPAKRVGGATPTSGVLPGVVASEPVVAVPVSDISLALRNQADAWRELGLAWQLPPVDGPSCAAWKGQGIECFKSDGGLAMLRLLGRPSILTLRDRTGELSYVTLVELDGQYATVRAGSQTQTVNLQSLAKQWRGEFATLWRAPPGYQAGELKGAALAWLDVQLAKAFGLPAQPGAAQSDAVIRAKVMAFQRAQGLKEDGMAGPITLMQLNRATGVDEPLLKGNGGGHVLHP